MTDQDGGRRAYIGSFTSGGGRGITTAAVDPATGALAPLAVTEAPENPSCLTLDPVSGTLYAVSEAEQGAVAAFRPTADGLIPLGPAAEVGGAGPTHLSVAGRRLLTAQYTSGSVSSLPIAPDGSVGGPPRVLAHRGSGPDPDRQERPHAHQVLPDPSGRWVLSVDLGTDSVRVCSLDHATGELRSHAETVLRAGTGPRHLAFHPDGDLLYVLHELEPQLTVCRWNPASGQLDPVGEVPVVPAGSPGAARDYPSELVVSRDGRFIWAAIRGTDAIATLSLSGRTEKPQLTGSVESGGSWPRDLVADPWERRLYVANEWSGNVTWFDIDRRTGRLRPAGRLDVPAAACVVFT
ncbi:lactonase family protein [Streptomyces sp. NPDC002990]